MSAIYITLSFHNHTPANTAGISPGKLSTLPGKSGSTGIETHENPVFIPDFPGEFKSIVYYKSGEPVKFKQIEEGVILTLGEEQMEGIDTVIEFRTDS